MSKKILFLTLETFSAPGGIQKMSRILAHALHQLGMKNGWNIDVFASHDQQTDLMSIYVPSENYKAFNYNKIKYVCSVLRSGIKADVVILSHINLSLLGCTLRLLNPKCKIWLIAHGIEVWRPLKFWKKTIWKVADKVICVSSFTKNKVIALHQAIPDRCVVLNNVLDPFLKLPEHFDKPGYLQQRYQLKQGDKIILTLARISGTEKYKGYEQIIKTLSVLKQSIPTVKYILAGPYDEPEKARIEQMIADDDLGSNFILTGFIEEKELADHFLLADLFVLPSKKEGFGIVFIEAMAFGLPVICGNMDGSTDAVRNEQMGMAIDPDNMNELEEAMLFKLRQVLTFEERKSIQQQCLAYFNELDYRNVLEKLIKND